MEPVGLAVGVVGLAGLFSTCLDAVERLNSWNNFTDESNLLKTLFEGQKLRLKRWGSTIGFDNGTVSADHHEVLDNPQILSMIRRNLQEIQKLCSNVEGVVSVETNKSTGFTSDALSLQSPLVMESRRKKLKWALRDKAKCTTQVQILASLVQTLHDLTPPGKMKQFICRWQDSSEDIVEHSESLHSNYDPWSVEFQQMLVKLEAATRRDVHTWLLGSHAPNGIYESAAHARLAGTFDWFLSRQMFLDWSSLEFPGNKAKMMWVTGAPGYGKTVLCARLVEHLCSTLDLPTAHFFFSSDFESRRDPFVAMRLWLTQLLSTPAVFELVRDEWALQSGPAASQFDVVRTFRTIVQTVPGLTFVLDGLDECMGVSEALFADGKTIANFLETVQQAVVNTSTRVLIVSRKTSEISQSFIRSGGSTWFNYTVSCDDVQADVEVYARSIVDKKLHNKDQTIQNDISRKLATRCNGQFLWIKLQEPSLRSGKNKKQLEAVIDRTPATLNQLYDRDWQRLRSLPAEESTRAVSLLRLAAFATRPLTVAEITEAVLVTDVCEDLALDEMLDSIDQDYVNGEILNLCGSLIEVKAAASEANLASMTIHLAHFSVKEFFIFKMSIGKEALVASERLNRSSQAIQNSILAIMCLRYLNFRSIWQGGYRTSCRAIRPFLDYAAGSWHKHAAESKPDHDEVNKLINEFFSGNSDVWSFWKEWYDHANYGGIVEQMKTSSPLFYAALLCLTNTVHFLIKNTKCNINEQCIWGRTALYVSCNLGDIQTAAVLLDAGGSITIADDNRWLPISAASEQGHLAIVKLLLEKGADATCAAVGGWTPLHLASDGGHVDVARLLLQNYADATAGLIDSGWTPLHMASESGYIDMVTLLLDSGADLESITVDGWTALHMASDNGHADLVALLLARGANLHSIIVGGWTALIVASVAGNAEVVKLLLAKGADATSTISDGRTALHLAAGNNFLVIAQMLLEHGADANAMACGWAPIFPACQRGYHHIVKLLLANGANATSADRTGSTPLHLAVTDGDIEIVRVIIEKTRFVDNLCKLGRSALFYACAKGDTDVVDYLLTCGASCTIVDQYDATPLFIATRNGHERIVERLITLDVGSGGFVDCLGKSLLWWASKSGNKKVVDLILHFMRDKGISVCDDDLTVQPNLKVRHDMCWLWCDCCVRPLVPEEQYNQCTTCLGGDFHLCKECVDLGMSCDDDSHQLVSRQERAS